MKKTTTEIKAKTESKILKKFRSGKICATIWEADKEIVLKDGTKKMIKAYNTTINKSYTINEDGKDIWKTTDNYQVEDIPKIKNVVDNVFNFLYSNED